MEVMEAYSHTTVTRTTITVDNGILAMDTIVAPIRMGLCHHAKAITIQAPAIEDTIDFRFQLNPKICKYCK